MISKNFKGAEKVAPADIEVRSAQYLYSSDGQAFFMDDENFEQYELDSDSIQDELQFLLEGQKVGVQLFENRPVNLEMPNNLFLKVVEAPNVVKGDTSGAVTKEVVVETGYRLRAPGFIKPGDEISIDTSTGEYRERKK